MVRRSGRRPGKQETRAAILTAARDAFALRGYDGATIRQIATGAGVDPALVHHYFGNKEQLFAATIDFPVNPGELVLAAVHGERTEVGVRLVRRFLTVWDSPAGAAGVALLRSAVATQLGSRLLREFVSTQIIRRVTTELRVDPAEAPLRGSLVAAQLSGLALTRYVLKLDPIATLPVETLVPVVGPTIQGYLTAPLPPPAPPAPPIKE